MRTALPSWLLLVTALSGFGCSSTKPSGDACQPGDQDGIVDVGETVVMTVSDTAFAVGGVDSGSTERNITAQNSSTVTLTLTNVGSSPHDMVIACIPTGLPAGCPTRSCFPKSAGIAALDPGESKTTRFTTPAVEGAYQFTSDEHGDTDTDSDGNVTGLVGEFVLM